MAVDLSEQALQGARRLWQDREHITWIQADVGRLRWKAPWFDVVCAFGFTDWDFLAGVPGLLKPGGLFLYQGFSRRQLEVKPDLDPSWTSTEATIARVFPGWRVLTLEETGGPPYRIGFAAIKP